MATSLMDQDCGLSCQKEAEFSFKFVITSLGLCDKDKARGFDEILLAITIDGTVLKFENFEQDDAGEFQFMGRSLTFLISPDSFSKKLKKCPIMLNLSRGCIELGTVKLTLSDCFVDAVKCEEFSTETKTDELTFFNEEGEQSAVMGLIIQLSRNDSGGGLEKLKKKMMKEFGRMKKNAEEVASISSSNKEDESLISALCDSNPSNSCDERSTKSLNFNDRNDCSFSEMSLNKTECLSLENKEFDCQTFPKNICESKATVRVCSQCFEDLRCLPDNASCPYCACNKQLPKKIVSCKSDTEKFCENQKVKEHIKSILQDIFLDTKERLIEDWKSLKKTKKTRKNKKTCEKENLRFPNIIKCKPKTKCVGLRKKHPGVVLGHLQCAGGGDLVPKNMGWLWNIPIEGLPRMRRGWQPGAVKKSVARIMKTHLNKVTEKEIDVSEDEKLPPTLHVKKKNGEFLIIMNPESEQEIKSPIVFKLTKTDEAQRRSTARKILKSQWTCGACCSEPCDCQIVKMKKLSKEFCLDRELTMDDLDDSSSSEIDFEFTSPNSLYKNICKKQKPKVSYAETQYECQELKEKESKCVQKEPEKCDDDDRPKVMKRKQVVIYEKPKICCTPCVPRQCHQHCSHSHDYRSTTNYNPIYAQCPPPPPRPVCHDQWFVANMANPYFS
ncbi:CLUMA_CG003066, isoform A [Clunio marinus]|uniref:CLUMA_CG003066, isoform A n=1 Tax=Clunio marinus TaxID=568069 RepID=A0A1J1HMY0_9DIPT|nr:CLUMA_CG003066, isoform A [Clunio marinus]